MQPPQGDVEDVVPVVNNATLPEEDARSLKTEYNMSNAWFFEYHYDDVRAALIREAEEIMAIMRQQQILEAILRDDSSSDEE